MNTLVSLLLLLVFLAGGFAAARAKLLKYTSLTDRIFSVALYLLLFSMGLKLGQNRDVLANLPMVGILAVTSTLFACAGTVSLQILFIPVYRDLERAIADGTSKVKLSSYGNEISHLQPLQGSRKISMLFHNLKKPLLLLVLVALGTGVGYLLPLVAIVRDGTVSNWILYFLLFIIGMQMAGSGARLGKMLFQPAVLLVPAVTIVGTLAGSLGTMMFEGMTPGRALALGSGFGWYSLSGVLISNLGDPMLGAAAFIANLLRETLAFLSIPLLRFTGRCESGIGIAGATSMDVTLPAVEDSWGAGVIPLSVAHGVILSFLVPFLVPLFMSF